LAQRCASFESRSHCRCSPNLFIAPETRRSSPSDLRTCT
jgi:hypothetical protein